MKTLRSIFSAIVAYFTKDKLVVGARYQRFDDDPFSGRIFRITEIRRSVNGNLWVQFKEEEPGVSVYSQNARWFSQIYRRIEE